MKERQEVVDEMLADYLREHPKKVPSNTSVIEMLEWHSIKCVTSHSENKNIS